MFRVFTTEEFDNNFNKLDGSEKIKVRKILKQLKENGASVGKPLKVSYFREKNLFSCLQRFYDWSCSCNWR